VFLKHVKREIGYHEKMLKVQFATKSRSSSKLPQLSTVAHEAINLTVTLHAHLPHLLQKLKHRVTKIYVTSSMRDNVW